jgi:nicotinamide-nucleotide amidase
LIDAQTDPTLATYAKENESYVRIASKRRTRQEAEDAIADMLVKVRGRIGKYIYSEDNEDLWNVVVRKLRENSLMISAAESCTGGLFAKTITDIAGASDVFDRSIVTYSNRAKMEELGVSAETLEKYGAVSEQTAREMAEGIARVSGSDICVSVTGIAGPGGGTEEKPVGLIYIGLWYDGETKVQKLMVRDTGRVFNRHRAMLAMMGMVNKCLDEKVCD